MNNFSIEYPLIFGLYLLMIFYKIYFIENQLNLYFPHLALLKKNSYKDINIINIFRNIGIFFAILSLSSPILINEYSNFQKNGRDIVLILDSSRSMSEIGFDKLRSGNSKFYTVKKIAKDFIRKRDIDRIGFITFADFPFISSPLTFDKKFLEQIIDDQKLGLAGKNTAINDALLKAYEILINSKSKSKVIILLTDGRDNMSKISLNEIKSVIKDSSTILYTIGITRLKNSDKQNYLEDLSKNGNGKYFTASNKLELEKIYNEINKMETSNLDGVKITQNYYLYIYTLSISIIFFLLFIYMQEKRRV